MIKMRHWIVTRFNLGLYRTCKEPEAWMEHRINLFQKITCPSLRVQTNQDFSYVILFDDDTPAKQVRYIMNLVPIKCCFGLRIKMPDDWHPKKYGERHSIRISYSPLKDLIVNESKYSIQTRMDNDDALTPNAVNSIQIATVNNRGDYVVDIIKGFMLDTPNKKCYVVDHPAGSPFLSLVQDNRNKMRTVYDMIHQRLATKFDRKVINLPLWVMNIHDRNVSNRVFETMIEREVDYEYVLKMIGAQDG